VLSGRPTAIASGRLGRLARWLAVRPRSLALAAAFLAVLAAAIGLPPNLSTSPEDMLPEANAQVQAMRELRRIPGGSGALVLEFSGLPEALAAALPPFIADLQGLPLVRSARGRLPADRARLGALLQLPPEEVDALRVETHAALLLGRALNPMLAQRLLGGWGGLADLQRQAALLDTAPPGRERVVVLPSVSSQQVRDCVAVVDAVERAWSERPHPGVAMVHVGGTYGLMARSADSLRRDLRVTSGLSGALVLLVLILGLRSLRAPLVIAPPLLLSALLHLAAMDLLFHTLNTYTLLGTAVLQGLGVDFGVHLVERYREARGEGADPDEALAQSWDRTAPACIGGAATSAVAFLALALGDFRGLSQLGVGLALGLGFSLASTLLLLPPLIRWLDPRGTAPPPVARAMRPSTLLRATAVVLTVVVGVWGARNLRFEYDITALGPDELRDELRDPSTRHAAAETPIVAPLAADDALRRALAAGDLEGIGAVVSLDRLLPADQRARLAALDRLAALAAHRELRSCPTARSTTCATRPRSSTAFAPSRPT